MEIDTEVRGSLTLNSKQKQRFQEKPNVTTGKYQCKKERTDQREKRLRWRQMRDRRKITLRQEVGKSMHTIDIRKTIRPPSL